MNSNTAKLIEVKEREEKNIADYPITNKVAKCHLHKLIIIMQLSPEGEVNSGVVIYRDSKHRGIYLALSTDPEGDSCFSIYQISWIKMKKSNFFVNLKRHLEGSFFYNLQTFRGFFKCVFTILLQIQQENSFLSTSKHRQADVSSFLGICLNDCFIYLSNFVFRKSLETRRHLAFGRKTVNSQGYSELRNAQKLLFTDLVNTKKNYIKRTRSRVCFCIRSCV